MHGNREGGFPVKHADHAHALDQLHEVFPGDIFHRDPAIGAGATRAVQSNQIRMLQRHHGLHGTNEALQVFLIVAEFGQEHFEGDRAIVVGVVGAKDDAGGAAADHRADVKSAKGRTGQCFEFLRIGGGFGFGWRVSLHGGHGVGEREIAHPQAQLGVADLQHVAQLEHLFFHGFAVDARAAGAAQANHRRLVAFEQDLAVRPRNARVIQTIIRMTAATDDHVGAGLNRMRSAGIGSGDNVQLKAHDRLASVGAGMGEL